jgi:hypothetical protein
LIPGKHRRINVLDGVASTGLQHLSGIAIEQMVAQLRECEPTMPPNIANGSRIPQP